ncbi:hypothetical protein RGR602_PB00210 (plasmid) [Rhizobium gallicum bv. gallicum R602sp]|uniref:Uncharacterized protein n=1 Tax=Rhizobium gallicum bv. gallicum R602sp TaxID=1041138 RepID=A0A0B4XB24_9HYPH|nr:hypothetical protein RGR602_PB00210 [Rhizobium gallicum bv. gallicum R602sp]
MMKIAVRENNTIAIRGNFRRYSASHRGGLGSAESIDEIAIGLNRRRREPHNSRGSSLKTSHRSGIRATVAIHIGKASGYELLPSQESVRKVGVRSELPMPYP